MTTITGTHTTGDPGHTQMHNDLDAAAIVSLSVVVHGANAATARPAGALSVVRWVGSAAPANAAVNDEWTDTVNKVVKRWNGASWDALGTAPAPKPVSIELVTASSTVTVPTGSNWGVWSRIMAGSATITKIGLYVVNPTGNITVALFRDNGADAPGQLVASSGAVACPAAGAALINLGGSFLAQPGDWFALAADNVAATFRASNAAFNQPLWRTRAMSAAMAAINGNNPAANVADTRVFALWGE